MKQHQPATLVVFELERARKQYCMAALHTAAGVCDVIHRMHVDGRAPIRSLQPGGSDVAIEESGHESPGRRLACFHCWTPVWQALSAAS